MRFLERQWILLNIPISIFARIFFRGQGGSWFDEPQPTPMAAPLPVETLDKAILLILGAALIVAVIFGAVIWRRIKS